jgi:hypothetical protein
MFGAGRESTGDATTDFLSERRTPIIDRAEIALEEARVRHYGSLAPDVLRQRLEALYDSLLQAAARRDLGEMLEYARRLAKERFSNGVGLAEVQVAINVLEETIWQDVFVHLSPADYVAVLGRVSTILGLTKDALAREYVSLATHAHTASLDLRSLFAGTA